MKFVITPFLHPINLSLLKGVVLYLILLSMEGHAQDTNKFQHRVYSEDIASLKFHVAGRPLSMPIVSLRGQRLILSFDDIGEYYRDLQYTIIHCNRDWTPSDIPTLEYLTGFDDAPLREALSARGTILPYLNYTLQLPNEDIGWKISGNYILRIWDMENNDEVLMDLRFVVFENRTQVTNAEVFRSTRGGMFDSHHQLTFSLGTKDAGLDDPMQFVTASVIQNSDWNTLIEGVTPRRFFGNELFFDQRNTVMFPSMREYRLADLRTLTSLGFRIADIQVYEDGINLTMETDELRGFESKYGDDRDINGQFVISNEDDRRNARFSSEYVHVLFSLHYFNVSPEADVYVLGAFNQFEPSEASRMEFNEMNSVFYKEILLKQGVYDYVYGVKMPGKPIEYRVTEGYDNRADNDYHILFYYRSFLDIYDRVIAYGQISSE